AYRQWSATAATAVAPLPWPAAAILVADNGTLPLRRRRTGALTPGLGPAFGPIGWRLVLRIGLRRRLLGNTAIRHDHLLQVHMDSCPTGSANGQNWRALRHASTRAGMPQRIMPSSLAATAARRTRKSRRRRPLRCPASPGAQVAPRRRR